MLKSDRVGRLTVTNTSRKVPGKNANTLPDYVCNCDCGKVLWVSESDLNRKRITSCGCLKIDNARINGKLAPTKHGHTTHRNGCSKTYEVWKNMIARCEYPNHISYKYYGAKGITVCERWHDFQNFLNDMGEALNDHVLDRINPFGDYEPDNCRWRHKSKKNDKH